MQCLRLNIEAVFISFMMVFSSCSLQAQKTDHDSGQTAFNLEHEEVIIERIDKQFTKNYFNGDSVAMANHYTIDGKLVS